jgi:hypothetical protein
VFRGPIDSTSVVQEILPVPFEARYVRVNPQTWQNGIAMQIEVFGCDKRHKTTTETPTSTTTTEATTTAATATTITTTFTSTSLCKAQTGIFTTSAFRLFVSRTTGNE